MVDFSFCSKTNAGVILNIKLFPNSKKDKIYSNVIIYIEDRTYVKVSVTSIASDNLANKDLISLLSKCLKISKSSFKIIKGSKSRYKSVLIYGFDYEYIATKLKEV